ncbi:hypothetical protein ACL9RL_02190 [Plantibacter sp. Mn2098]|uniref:hypothetical protein n=1 Tax=Plantibacter sp. Mn2098 TaxID=3395266 RepID=UPI003BEA718D
MQLTSSPLKTALIRDPWWMLAILPVGQALLVILRALTGKDTVDPTTFVHYLGSDATSLGALLNPNAVTATLWAALTALALFTVIRTVSPSRVAAFALTSLWVVSPLAWEAFRPGSPYALNPLVGIAIVVVAQRCIAGALPSYWAGIMAAIAIAVNATNVIGVFVLLGASVLALFPPFRNSAQSVFQSIRVLGMTILGAAIALVTLSILMEPDVAQRFTTRPLTLPEIAMLFGLPFQGGILSNSASGGISLAFPFHYSITVGLWWLCAAGIITAVVVLLRERRWNAVLCAILAVALFGGPVAGLGLARLTHAYFGLTGLTVGSLVPMFLIAAAMIARQRVVNIVLISLTGALFASLVIWTVVSS